MPPLMFAVPVIDRPQPIHQGKGALPNGRKYNDEPLPTKLSDHAPKSARIVGRIFDVNTVTYTLRIGDVELDDIGIDEILDYVSPLELEAYENGQFVEERDILEVLEAEKQLRKMEKLERQKERAKRKGVAISGESDSAEGLSGGEDGVAERGGRARPRYTHLFKEFKGRRRRRRDPETGELMPLSDEDGLIHDDGLDVSTDADSAPARPTMVRSSAPSVQLPKRRRRKRDKATGELLPLSPEPADSGDATEQKRRRRRRHPVTGELMPIGWRYDPEREDMPVEKTEEASFRRLSITQGPNAKRPRLAAQSSTSRSVSPLPNKMDVATNQLAMQSLDEPISKKTPQSRLVVDLISSDDEPGDAPSALKSFLSPTARKPTGSHSSKTPSPRKPLPNEMRTSIKSPSLPLKTPSAPAVSVSQLPQYAPRSPHRTSILQPTAAAPSPPTSVSNESGEAEDFQDAEDDDWQAEAILNHRYSDPRTHPPAFGEAPIMLYQTKWARFDELRWEPLQSFGDRNFVSDYRRRAGLPSEPSDDEDEEMEDDEYEIEYIKSHHLSDPRTHPTALGKTPVMLYQVKWKGWEDTTWEPASSFEDPRVLAAYRKRVGLDGEDRGMRS